MKKKRLCHRLYERPWRKILMIMRLFILLTCCFTLSLSANTLAQKERVSLNMKEVNVQKLFDEIQRQTDLYFLFNVEQVAQLGKISVKVKNEAVESVLASVFKGSALTWVFNGNMIVVQSREEKEVKDVKKITIKGKVRDEKKQPLPGVTVQLKGFSIGTATDTDGQYQLVIPNAPQKFSLVFSFVGMVTQEIPYTGKDSINVVMKEDVETLEDVVITGYLNVRKSSFTGNATTVTRDQLLKTNNKNVIAALQVFDPSFRIKENNTWGSDPNALPEFNIRGESSIGMNKSLEVENMKQTQRTNLKDNPNLPIFILDGFEVSVQKIYDMDMNRIESMTILKDAAATAIYGSRAANGVVVVTTVAPSPGKLNVTYNLSGGMEFPDLSDYNLCNAEEKLEVERLSGVYSSIDKEVLERSDKDYNEVLQMIQRGVNTDWLSQPLRNVFNHTHSLYIDGGTESLRYAVDFSYDSNNGTMKGSYRSRMGTGLSLDYRYKKLQVRNYISYNTTRSQDSPYGTFGEYAKMQPYAAIYDGDGNLLEKVDVGKGETRNNPLYSARELDSYSGKGRIEEITDNLSVNLYFFEGFQFRGQFAISKITNKSESFIDPLDASFSSTTNDRKGSLTQVFGDDYNWNINAMFYYNRALGKHFINATAGLNVQEVRTESKDMTFLGFGLGSMHSSSFAAQQLDKTNRNFSKNRLFGVLASLNYSYNNVYLLDASLRFDGSSQFGSDKRFAPFWSVGVGINVHNYSFLRDNWLLSRLRIRGSYGVTGKVNFPSYTAITTYESESDAWYYTGPASHLVALGNPDLKWENTKSWDGGLELGFFNDIVNLSANYYYKKTVDLIDVVSIRTSSGFSTYRSNSGAMVNKGFEVNLSATVFRDRDWVVSVTGNLASNSNEITELGAASMAYNKALDDNYNKKLDDILNSATGGEYYQALVTKPLQKYYVGASSTALYAVRSAGIDPVNGKEKFIRKDGSSTYTWDANDQVVVGDNNPDAQGSFGINVGYKGFYLNASFLYQWGGQVYNETLLNKVENADIKNGNVDKRVLSKRWKVAGDLAPYYDLQSNVETKPTSRFVQNYDLLSFSGLSFGYDFSQELIRKINLTSLGLRFNMNDVCRWSTVKEERGTSYPYAKNFSFTLNVGF